MNKAFTKETDEEIEDDEVEEPSIPQGKRYITPGGAKKLQTELLHLRTKERPEVCRIVEWAAGNGDRSENADYTYGKKRLREIDRKIRSLSKRLEVAEVIDPTKHPATEERVFFGATVTILDEDGEEKTYSIVGVDEIDLPRGRISWLSPLGAALLKGAKDEVITFKSPKGAREIEIVDVKYVSLED